MLTCSDWTAKHHKQERNDFIHRLQDLALSHSVRVTLLGGDVHLGSIGEFYSNPHLRIPREKDHRYIPNIISSAIVNTPPAEAVSNVLSKRNKVHHLDDTCDETQIPVFEYDVNGKKLNNPCLLPRRNWCSISQEANSRGRLDVRLNVEIDSTNADGRTQAYPYSIPALDLTSHSDVHAQQHYTPTGAQQQQNWQPHDQYSQQHGQSQEQQPVGYDSNYQSEFAQAHAQQTQQGGTFPQQQPQQPQYSNWDPHSGASKEHVAPALQQYDNRPQ